ncbi:MAG: ABC transporter permease subunit [Rhodospirillales bacterium]|nr:ABC transporter permease subunit [Rhodospirillales bacterium]
MTAAPTAYATPVLRVKPGIVLIIAAIVVAAAIQAQPTLLAWANDYPKSWIIPFAKNLSAFVKWLLKEADLGLFTFKEFTRAIGALLDAPTLFLKSLLVTGFKLEGKQDVLLQIPPLSWLGVTIIFVMLGSSLGNRRLTLFILVSFLYVAFIGLWESTMLTLASIVVAVVLGILVGVLLGIAAFKWTAIDRILTPVFDVMQTMPVFAYMVPALMMFGYGPAAAMVVTLIYAMPPMARVTKISLAQVNSETVEFGRMAGCSTKQLTWKVMVPSIRPRLMVGVNQVIMLTLNMVIIASLIGAGGLGFDVWQALKSLRIGQGAEAGIAITLVAIVLDRISQEFAARRPVHTDHVPSFTQKYRLLILVGVIAIGTTIIGQWIPSVSQVPDSWTFSTGKFWDNIIDWININGYEYIDAFRRFFFIYLLKPSKGFMLGLPWLGTVLVIAAVGYHVGGLRLAALGAVLISFIAAVGLWEKAMISAYLVGVCVFLASAIGIPIGILSARNERVHKVVQVIIDTLQTLPSFVYLIPVIMLFSVGEFSAMVAVVMYAIVPAIRYTDHSIRQVPADLIEASRAMGCTPLQILKRVQIPLALPGIMLGVNQTLMMGLSMLVITALVGTRDLGQETLIAISKVDPGRGITAGICVAFIAITADRLINAWVQKRKSELGLNDASQL